jgi:hypothetical protein
MAVSKRTRLMLGRALGLLLLAWTLTGCVEAVTLGLSFANDIMDAVLTPRATTPAGAEMCAPPGTQAARQCTDRLLAQGWEVVEYRDGQWHPVATR